MIVCKLVVRVVGAIPSQYFSVSHLPCVSAEVRSLLQMPTASAAVADPRWVYADQMQAVQTRMDALEKSFSAVAVQVPDLVLSIR